MNGYFLNTAHSDVIQSPITLEPAKEALKEVMRDHANYPNSICRHEDNRGGMYSTLSALIYRPEDRLMLATNGTPCTNPFQEFTISAVEPAAFGAKTSG